MKKKFNKLTALFATFLVIRSGNKFSLCSIRPRPCHSARCPRELGAGMYISNMLGSINHLSLSLNRKL